MYMINLIIIYDVINIFCMKIYKSLRKLRLGLNRYTVNWSTTSNEQTRCFSVPLKQYNVMGITNGFFQNVLCAYDTLLMSIHDVGRLMSDGH